MSCTISQKIQAVADTIHERAIGIPTGFHKLDHHTFGLHPQELTLIAGRPSMGKSSLMTDLVINISVHCPVMVFSLEMPENLLIERMISNKAEVSLRRLKQPGVLTTEEKAKKDRAVLALKTRDIIINDASILNPEQMITFVNSFRGLVDKLYIDKKYPYNTGAILVDYLGLMEAGKYTANSNEKLDYVIKTLRQLGKDLNLIVVVLHQLNRKVEDRPDHSPRLSDLRDSGTLEQHADNVILLHRPAYYKMKDLGEDVDDDGEAYFLLAKQRNGATGRIPVVYIPEIMGFRNLGAWCGQPEDEPLLYQVPEVKLPERVETIEPDTKEETSDDGIVATIDAWNDPNEVIESPQAEPEIPEIDMPDDDIPF